MKPRFFIVSQLLFARILTIIAITVFVAAAAYHGEPMQLSQPDGSEVTVHLFGTPFFATAESPDGFTLIRDEDGWICYAELSADGSELVSTGVRYTATSRSPLPAARRGLRINERATMEERSRNVKALGDGEEESDRRFWDRVERHERRRAARESGNLPAPEEDEPQHAPGEFREVVGLALFISFPDFPGPTGDVNARWLRHADSVYNSPEYTRGTGAGYGSVYSYFMDISGGLMSVKNYVSVFVQAPNTFAYYDGADNYGRVGELITDALRILNQNTAVANEIASRVTRHSGRLGQKDRPAFALNIHPIRSGQRWAHGIWSHRGWYRGNQTVGGVEFYDYQFSGLGSAGTITNSSTLSTNVIIHENGHMLFDWPDLYSYVSGRNFVVGYCTMSSGTVMPNPFFRDLEGWVTVTDVTNAPGFYTHQANSNTAFVFRRTDVTGTNAGRERYYIESRFANGRSTGIPGSGLIVWHIHTSGDNANYDSSHTTANRRTPRVAIVQANNGTGNPNAQSTFTSASGRNLFNRLPGDNTTPQRRWHTQNGATGGLWGGTSGTGGTNAPVSGLIISEISAAPTASNPRMTFRIGNQPTTFTLTVANGGTGGGDYEPGTSVNVSASNTRNGERFVRWSSSNTAVIPANIYNRQGTVTTTDANVTLTPNYGRVHPIPATAAIPRIEVDTSGFAIGVASRAVTGATGGHLGRFAAVGNLAEYAVNVTTAGTYRFTYRLMTVTGQTARRFYLRDMTNDVILDSVQIPRTSTAEITTISGTRVANLPAGNAIWQLQSSNGTNIDIDWFTAEPAMTVLEVVNGTGSGMYEYGEVVPVVAQGPDGFQFVRWEGHAVADSTSPSTTVTIGMNTNIVLTAVIIAPSALTVENGTGSGVYMPGAVVTITAADSTGYEFEHWDGDSLSLAAVADVNSMETEVTMGTEPITLTAVFKQTTSIRHITGIPPAFGLRAASNGRVSFQVAKTEHVSIRVYDIRGRMVAVLSDGVRTPGYYSMNIVSNRALGSGFYIVRMQSETFTKSVRVNYRR
jgi:M6 family metalloprotease-like protein